MSDALVVPRGKPSWKFDPQQWLDAVCEHWPAASGQLGGYSGEPAAAVALLPGGDYELEVVLFDDRRSIAFEPMVPDAIAEFVTWWATQLPAGDAPVHLFVGGGADRFLPLTAAVTVEEVRRFLTET